MNLDELRSVRRTERQKDSLQHLRDSFYEDVADYIAAQKAERQRAADAADDPFSDPEVGRLTDEIETAEDVVEAIYERRVGKVVKLASFAAADMSADTNGLTAEERDLFDDLVSRIKRNRDTVLDVLAGKRSGSETTTDVGGASNADSDTPDSGSTAGMPREDSPAEAPPSTADDDTPPPPPDVDPDAPADAPGDVLADAMGGDDAATPADGGAGDRSSASDAAAATPDPSDADRPTTEATAVADGEPPGDGGPDGESPDDGTAGATDDTERVTLRITQDVGQILGVDEREYDLETEDVVTLPTTNADPLVERGAAERLD